VNNVVYINILTIYVLMLHCFTCTDFPFTLCFVKPCSHEAIKYTQEMPFFRIILQLINCFILNCALGMVLSVEKTELR